MMVDETIRGRDPAVRVAAGEGDLPRRDELLEAGRGVEAAVAVAGVGSTGLADLEPLVLATFDGETAFFPDPGTDEVRAVVEALDDGRLSRDGAVAVVDHDPERKALPVPEDGPLAVGTRDVLSSCGWAIPTSFAEYRGGDSLATELVDDAMAALRGTKIKGRGRGDTATDESILHYWEIVREADGDPLVVVNANEADPHADTDRLLLESAPFSVLDPAVTAASAIEATDVVVYLNETETLVRERVASAADALADELDMNIPMRVVVGPDEYKAGEPTIALEAIEGNHRLEARRTPPGPDEYGIDGRPTLVHTPRTFAQIGRVLAGDEPGGVASDPGTRLFTVAGDVAAPATVELPTDETLETALSAVDSGDRSAACVGGVFGGVTRTLDVPANAAGLESAHLGTNGVIELLDESTCPVAFAGECAAFAKEENCGRCVPCREGSKQLVTLLREVYDGEYKDGMLRELVRVMRETSVCGFGRDAARPVSTAMDAFGAEFSAHAAGRCPTGACDR